VIRTTWEANITLQEDIYVSVTNTIYEFRLHVVEIWLFYYLS